MRRRRQNEGGFALLLIFAIAAAAAILLYLEMPRAVFESARAKEEMLVERGEQFKVALRRFYTKTRRLPTSLDELENTNGIRFLRRKYVDPMTGKSEWRLIHLGPAGELADSKVTKPGNANQQEKSVNTLVTEGPQVGAGLQDGTNVRNLQDVAMRQRASDRMPTPGGAEANPGEAPPPPPPPGQGDSSGQNPSNPQVQAISQGSQPNSLQQQMQNGNFPGIATAPMVPGNSPFVATQYDATGRPIVVNTTGPSNSQAGGMVPGGIAGTVPGPQGTMGGNPGAPSPFGAVPGSPQSQGIFPGQPGYPGSSQGGSAVPGGQNPALDMIRNLLTTPRQGGAPGTASSTPAQGAMTGQIAGVASKYEGDGIKLINERSRIDEWEFVFDFRNARTTGQQQGGNGAMPGQGMQQQGGSGQMCGFGGGMGGGGRQGQGGGNRNGQGGGRGQGGQGRGGAGGPFNPGFGYPGGNQQSPGFPNRPR